MFSIRVFVAACALAALEQASADTCGPAYHTEVAAAVQTLRANCASWAAYLASGGVWTCDSACHDAVVNLVDTLPDCTFGGPYGQNYKQVAKGMAERCDADLSDSDDTTATSSSGALRTARSSASIQSTSIATSAAAIALFVAGVFHL
ncbi:hypothetical protein PRIC2_012174 [Phytophthora ramorum]